MKYVNLGLTFDTRSEPLLIDISSLLYDYELFYDYHVLTLVEEYRGYTFSQYFWYRSGRPIDYQDKLQIRYIRYGSPLTLIIAVVGWVAVKVVEPMVRISGEIADWPVNRRKAQAEAIVAELKAIEKSVDIEYKELRNRRIELLLERSRYQTEEERLKLKGLKEKQKVDTLKRLEHRLSENKYRLVELSTEIEDIKSTD
jgi:hypothetical protein